MNAWSILTLAALLQGGGGTDDEGAWLEPTWFGTAVDTVGDANLDGADDFVVGAWWQEGRGRSRGRVVVFSGRSGEPLHTLEGPGEEALFGLSVAGAGDVDDDGAGDFIVGAPPVETEGSGGGRRRGSARVYSGRTGELVHVVEGDRKTGLFGLVVAGAGDVDQDGFADFAVGAPGGGFDGCGPGEGRVRVFSGRKGDLLHEWSGDEDGDRFGWSVDGAGDVDGDGSSDVLVGAWRGEYVRVFSGQDGDLLQEYRPSVAGGRYGWSVAGAGDTNQDGLADLVVGIPRGRPTGALVISGKKARDLLSWEREQDAGREGWSYGISVDGAGDVNADGFADVIVGDPGYPAKLFDERGGDLGPFLGRVRGSAARPGRAYVYSGHDGELLHFLRGDEKDDWFGVRVRTAGDVDQDGKADLIVGEGRQGQVHARVYSGADGELLYRISM